jgi:hypothetical protein
MFIHQLTLQKTKRERKTHFPRSSLRQIRNDINLLRSREWTDYFADLEDEFFDEVCFVVGVVGEFAVGGRLVSLVWFSLGRGTRVLRFESDESVYGLSGEFVCGSDDWVDGCVR